MENKNKRGCNYTAQEKEMLLVLIQKYQDVIENKETNARIILKKRETWDSLTRQYNAVATSGTRTWQQLRHLYENIKQRSKKKLADENRKKFYENESITNIKKKALDDKRELTCTGGGPYKSSNLTNMDAQILAMVAPQVKPLRNPYDDAAFYFGDTEMDVELAVPTETICDDERASDSNALDAVPSTSNSQVNENYVTQKRTVHSPTHDNDVNKDKAGPKTLKKKCIARGSIKELYFKTKLQTARLEKKYLINREKRENNRQKMEHNKYKIEMEILHLRKKRLQGRP